MTPLNATAVEERIDRHFECQDDHALYEPDTEVDADDYDNSYELEMANMAADFGLTYEEACRLDELYIDPYSMEEAPEVCPLCGNELERIDVARSESGYQIGRFCCMNHDEVQDEANFWMYIDGPFTGCIVPDEDH